MRLHDSMARCLGALMGLALAAGPMSAQRADTSARALPGGAGTIVGMTIDTLGKPIAGVEILLRGDERITRSGPDGAFRVTDVREGRHELRARRIGFEPHYRRVDVGPEGGRAVIVLRPAAPTLQRVVTSAERAGLAGVISDTAMRPLAGAEVRVHGASARWARTDANGAFFIPLDRGDYMVRLSADGFETRLVSVRIPADSGRWMGVMLRAGETSRRTRIALEELRYRLAWAPAMASFFTREELAQWGAMQLHRVVAMGEFRSFDASCLALIDGGPERLPLWVIDADEVESVEVYPRGARLPRSMSRQRERDLLLHGDCPRVFVWMRR